jgi:hypothetical protein
MKTIDIFYQTEGLREIAHLECGDDKSFGLIKEAIIKKHGLDADALIFVEDADEPADTKELASKMGESRSLKVHIHRCREIKVAVTFNGETVHHTFSPATTVAKIKKWAAERKFEMTEEEAGEHVLQITGTHDRPAPNVHVGSLVGHPACHIAFDLVPDERVNGSSGTAA